MNTTFSIRLRGADYDAAQSSIRRCFELLEELENTLSRYRHDSDISRINQMKAGEELLVEPHTYECLKHAMHAYQATQGLFDITLGTQVTHRKESVAGNAPSTCGQLKIAEDRPLVQCLEVGRLIDLGGIGKGYALDQWAQALEPLNLESALLSSGTSTHLAIGSRSWPIEMIHHERRETHMLSAGGFSVSGIQVQGNHLVHPDAPDETDLPLEQVWVAHPQATYADAFSTACLLMRPEELTDFFESLPELTFLQAELPNNEGLIIC